MEHDTTKILKRWRHTLMSALGLVVVSGAFLALSAALIVDFVRNGAGDTPTSVFVIGTSLFALVALFPALAIRAHITATTRGIEVQNMLRHRSIEWSDVVHIRTSYMGLTISSPTFNVVSSVAHTHNYQRWLGRKSRGDEVVEELRAMAAERGKSPAGS